MIGDPCPFACDKAQSPAPHSPVLIYNHRRVACFKGMLIHTTEEKDERPTANPQTPGHPCLFHHLSHTHTHRSSQGAFHQAAGAMYNAELQALISHPVYPSIWNRSGTEVVSHTRLQSKACIRGVYLEYHPQILKPCQDRSAL